MSIPVGGINGHIQEPTTFSTTGTVKDSTVSPVPTRKATEVLAEEKPPLVSAIDPSTCPPVIPPDHTNRTLVVCFDGTGDQFDSDNSNIVQLVQLLKKDDRTKQLVYYQSGIGTYTLPQIASPFTSRFRKTLDEMFAWNLDAHVMSGYEFLMQNYITGDKICIFGFSRGAYTARSLAGMLHKVGLLPAGNSQQVPFAYKMYTRADDIGWEQSTGFKKAFCVDVSIEFVGVWDTVDSVGIIPKRLPFTTSNTIVRTFRHAVALDERRAKFKANLWNRPNANEAKLGSNPTSTSTTTTTPKPSSSSPATFGNLPRRSASFDDPDSPSDVKDSTLWKNILSDIEKTDKDDTHRNSDGHRPPTGRKEDEGDRVLNTLERKYSEKSERTTDIEEVWFAGCHSDVGGGSVSNKTPHSLARIALRWMVRECFKTNSGIMFKSSALKEIGMDPSTLYPFVKPRPPLPPLSPADRIRNPPAKEIPIRPHKHLRKKKQKARPETEPDMQTLIKGRTEGARSEEEQDLLDVLSPKYDQLKIKKRWWVLELIPLQLRYQRGDNQWVSYFASNMAHPRFIPQQRTNGFKVHRSVKLRMEAEFEDEKRRSRGKKYAPKPKFKVEPTWID